MSLGSSAVYWWIGLIVVFWFFLHKSPWGNWVFAVGGDPESARNAGIPVSKLKIWLFNLCSVCTALAGKQSAHVLRIVNEAKRRGLAVIFITHQVMHAMAVGDHFAVLIRGAIAADFRKNERTREEIADLMAGGESMIDLEANIEGETATV